MGFNIFVLAFCLLLGFLVLRFGKPRAKTGAALRRLGLLVLVLALFLSANAGMAWLGRRALVAVLDTPPTTSAQQWATLTVGTEVVVVGQLSPEAKSDDPRYAAYMQCWGGCDYHGPRPLPVAIEEGTVGVANSDYQDRNWGVLAREPGMSDGEFIAYLEPDAPVVVVGAVGEPSEPPAATPSLVAQVVYAGSYEAFAERAEQRLTVPTILLFANVLSALIAIGLGTSLLLRRNDP